MARMFFSTVPGEEKLQSRFLWEENMQECQGSKRTRGPSQGTLPLGVDDAYFRGIHSAIFDR